MVENIYLEINKNHKILTDKFNLVDELLKKYEDPENISGDEKMAINGEKIGNKGNKGNKGDKGYKGKLPMENNNDESKLVNEVEIIDKKKSEDALFNREEDIKEILVILKSIINELNNSDQDECNSLKKLQTNLKDLKPMLANLDLREDNIIGGLLESNNLVSEYDKTRGLMWNSTGWEGPEKKMFIENKCKYLTELKTKLNNLKTILIAEKETALNLEERDDNIISVKESNCRNLIELRTNLNNFKKMFSDLDSEEHTDNISNAENSSISSEEDSISSEKDSISSEKDSISSEEDSNCKNLIELRTNLNNLKKIFSDLDFEERKDNISKEDSSEKDSNCRNLTELRTNLNNFKKMFSDLDSEEHTDNISNAENSSISSEEDSISGDEDSNCKNLIELRRKLNNLKIDLTQSDLKIDMSKKEENGINLNDKNYNYLIKFKEILNKLKKYREGENIKDPIKITKNLYEMVYQKMKSGGLKEMFSTLENKKFNPASYHLNRGKLILRNENYIAHNQGKSLDLTELINLLSNELIEFKKLEPYINIIYSKINQLSPYLQMLYKKQENDGGELLIEANLKNYISLLKNKKPNFIDSYTNGINKILNFGIKHKFKEYKIMLIMIGYIEGYLQDPSLAETLSLLLLIFSF